MIIDQLPRLKNLRYREHLRAFGEKYGEASFTTLEQEYGLVFDALCAILDESVVTSLNNVLRKMMRIEIAVPHLDEAYRDHFIHPFQEFLLGNLIIDSYYEKFRKWYSDSLNANRETDFETCWLLSTIFHDRAKPLTVMKRTMEEIMGPFIPTGTGYEEIYSKVIASVYGNLVEGSRLESWTTPSEEFTHPLVNLLKEYCKRENHGVLGAFALLEHVRRAGSSESAITATEAMAALAIALHDHEPRADFLTQSVLPMKLETFPIPCLLMYCDAAQEWGRPFRSLDPQIYLVDLKLDSNRVLCEVSFPTYKLARDKLSELETVQTAITCSDLDFSYSVRVHVSR